MAELHRAVVKSMGEERTSEDSCLSSEVQSQSVQVGDLKVLSDNDTNFDHLQLAGEKRTSEDSCLSSEVRSKESQIVRVGDLEVLSDNDTNFDHLQLAVEILGPGPGHKKRDGAKYLAMMEMLRVDTIIGTGCNEDLSGKAELVPGNQEDLTDFLDFGYYTMAGWLVLRES